MLRMAEISIFRLMSTDRRIKNTPLNSHLPTEFSDKKYLTKKKQSLIDNNKVLKAKFTVLYIANAIGVLFSIYFMH